MDYSTAVYSLTLSQTLVVVVTVEPFTLVIDISSPTLQLSSSLSQKQRAGGTPELVMTASGLSLIQSV